VLARRDDVAFVELACPRCGSTALGLLMSAASPGGEPLLDVAAEMPASGPPIGEPADDRAAARSTFRPVSMADVETVRRDLEAWDGDLVGWLDALDRGDRRGSVVDR
jgi:hypothetical protein